MPADLPARPNLEWLKNQAKALLRDYRRGEPDAVATFRSFKALRPGAAPKLADAQRMIARQYGFSSWRGIKARVASMTAEAPDPVEQVKKALRDDDAALLREVLARHPELRARVDEPLFPFDSPAINHARSKAMLDVLLEAGADINARSRWWAGGFGILHGAGPELAAYAIDRGAVVDAHAAARLGMIERLRALLDADPALVRARGPDGQTPLHLASSVETAELLLDHGADIDARDVDHESTPAQYMVRDRPAIARYLLGRGCATDILMAAALGDVQRVRQHLDADPSSIRMSVSEAHFPKRDPRAGGTIYIWTLGWNKTPHAVAREFGHEDVVRLLMERSGAASKLAQACESGDEPAARALLSSHPDVVQTLSVEDRRKVVDAAQDNNTRAVALMLMAGWPVDARGQHRGTALHWAAWHGNVAMVREVLRHRPPLEDTDNEFSATPLGWATHGSEHGWHRQSGDYAGTAELLCAAGARAP